MTKINTSDDFWKKVNIKSIDECWEWVGSCDTGGYGQFGMNFKRYGCHRLSWTLTHGQIPEYLCVLHRCDNKLCCNPNHLWLGTYSENNKDRHNKKRDAVGKFHGRHKLTNEQIIKIRELYSTNKYTQKELSIEFSVCREYISEIILNKVRKGELI